MGFNQYTDMRQMAAGDCFVRQAVQFWDANPEMAVEEKYKALEEVAERSIKMANIFVRVLKAADAKK